jgi:hypothetical protein
MDKDPLKFQVMADSQKARRDERRKALIEASPWMKAALEAYEKENK